MYTEAEQSYALMIITADSDTSGDLVRLLTESSKQIPSPTDAGVNKKEIEWIDDVETLLQPIRKDLTVD